MTRTAPPGVDPDSGEIQVRPFADVLREIGRGTVHEEASQALLALTAAVAEHGRKGSLTLTIAMEPAKGDASTLITTAQVTTKPPKGNAISSIFFIDGTGNLTREDPRQMHLPLRGVPASDQTDIEGTATS